MVIDPQIERIYRAAGLPENHWECRLSEIPECEYKKTLIDWISGIRENIARGKGFLFIGRHGYGKSGCAAILMKAALSKTIAGLWVAAENLPKYKIEEDDHMYSPEVTMYERIQTVPLLVIDDLIVREKTAKYEQWVETHAELVIRRRVDSKLSTILTTNHSVDTIAKVHKAMASIMSEATQILNIDEKNFRAKR